MAAYCGLGRVGAERAPDGTWQICLCSLVHDLILPRPALCRPAVIGRLQAAAAARLSPAQQPGLDSLIARLTHAYLAHRQDLTAPAAPPPRCPLTGDEADATPAAGKTAPTPAR